MPNEIFNVANKTPETFLSDFLLRVINFCMYDTFTIELPLPDFLPDQKLNLYCENKDLLSFLLANDQIVS